VPTQVLDSADTTRATLQALCSQRTILFGDNDSDASLKTSLLRFNAAASTAWGADLHWLSVHVRRQALTRRGRLSAFQAAVAHPDYMAVHPLTGQPAPSRARRAPAVAQFPLAPVGCATQPERALSPQPRMPDRRTSSPSRLSPTPRRRADHPTSPRRGHTPSQSFGTLPPAGGRTDSGGRRPAALHAARLVQSLLEKEAERVKNVATSQQVAAVQGTVD